MYVLLIYAHLCCFYFKNLTNSLANSRLMPKFDYDSCNPSIFLSPDPPESMTPHDTVGTRYDIFSRLPVQESPSTNLSSGFSSDMASIGYSDYDQDYMDRPPYGYRLPGVPSSSSPPPSSFAEVPYLNSISMNGYSQRTHNSQLPLVPSESDYDADYLSDAFSPSFSTEDTSDFSSPELTQSRRFPEPAVEQCIPSWQPILTADPITRERIIISVDDSEHDERGESRSKLPTKKLDVYISGPNENGKYICNFNGCNKPFGRRYNIRTHIQTHLSDKPHSCTMCSARFVRGHDLRRHAKIHEDSKQYICLCGKGFKRQDALTRHRLSQICVGGFDHTDPLDGNERE